MTAPTIIPTSPSELEAMLDDSATMQALFKEGKFGEFTKNYMSAFQAKNADFAQQVRQEVQKVTADLLREHGNTGDVSRPDLTPATRTSSRATLYGKNAPGTKVDQLFKTRTTPTSCARSGTATTSPRPLRRRTSCARSAPVSAPPSPATAGS